MELLQSDEPVGRVVVQLGAQGRIIGDIIKAAKRRGVRVDRIPPNVANKVMGSGNHQGVMAEVDPVSTYRLEMLGSDEVPVRNGLIVALDNVTDPHHLGAVARSALGAGADALLMAERRSAPLSDVAVKASAGTLMRLPVIRETNLAQSLTRLKGEGWWIHGAAGGEGKVLYNHEWDERTVLVIGSEGEGLSQRSRELCDHLVQIPLDNRVESLSVSAASSVILFDLARKRRESNGG